jgi:Ca2+-binding EF-hand superfamily protein
MDKDKDGKVSFEEYRQKIGGRNAEKKEKLRKKGKKYRDTPEDRFKLLDKDSDGFITLEEWEAYFAPVPVGRKKPQQPEETPVPETDKVLQSDTL